MARVVITGGGGFVGHALWEMCLEREIPCIALSRSPVPGCTVVGDLRASTAWADDRYWGNLLTGCDAIIHLAARAHVMRDRAVDSLTEYRRANVEVTRKLATCAQRFGVKRFVYVSSIKVNGERTLVQPFSVDMDPKPEDPYGVSKLEAEEELRRLCLGSSMEYVIVRPPLIYGPGVKANFKLLMQLVKLGAPLPLGSIANRRSMIGLQNFSDLILACVENPAAAHQTFLVSDDEDLSTSALVELLAHEMRKGTRLFPVPLPILKNALALIGKESVFSRLADDLRIDITHTRQVLNWNPRHSVEYGIRETVKAFLSAN